MYFRFVLMYLSVAITTFVLILSLMNSQTTDINLLGNTYHLPLGLLTFSTCISGSLVPLTLLFVFFKRRTSQTRKLEQWQKQDSKLLNEIVSDREKQLEAKIATLEAALKSALKKNL